MRKSYYIDFGSSSSVDILEKILSAKLDLDFTRRTSSYIGNYCSSDSYFADAIYVVPNKQATGDYIYEEKKEIKSIIKIFITEGKNKDKLSKKKYVLMIFPQIEEISILLKDEEITEKN